MWPYVPPRRDCLMKPISMNSHALRQSSAHNDGPLAWCVLRDSQWRKPFARWRLTDSPQACNCNWNASKAHPSWRQRRTLSRLANRASKSHCLAAVGYAVIEAGYPVFWTPTSTLVQRLLAAKRDLRLPQELSKLDKFACVILDD